MHCDYDDFSERIIRSSVPAILFKPIYDLDGSVVDLCYLCFNPSFAMHFNISGILARKKKLSSYNLPYFNKVIRTCKTVLEAGAPRTIRIYIDPKIRPYKCTFTRSKFGNIIAKASIAHTFTGGAEKKYRDSDSCMRNLFDCAPAKLIIDPKNGNIIKANRAAEQFYGWNKDQLRSMTIYQIDTSSATRLAGIIKKVETNGYYSFQVRHRLHNNDVHVVEVHSSRVHWEGLIVHFATIINRAQKNENKKNSTLLSSSSDSNVIRCFEPFLSRYGGIIVGFDDMLAKLVPYGKIVGYRPKDHFLDFGDVECHIGFINVGFFRLYMLTTQGKDCTMAFFRPGFILGSFRYYHEREKCLVAIESLSDSEVFVINRKDLKTIIRGDSRWLQFFDLYFSEQLRRMHTREYSLYTEVKDRYLRFLADEMDVIPYLKNYHIASYLGISPETLSRLRKRILNKKTAIS